MSNDVPEKDEINSASAVVIGIVTSDGETPTFEIVRVKLKAGRDVPPGSLLHIPTMRNGISTILIGRVRSAYEHNPNEQAENINVRDTLAIPANYPKEEDSTLIYRLVDVDLIEEICQDGNGKTIIRAPQTLPNSGAAVSIASQGEILQALGTIAKREDGLFIGTTTSGTPTDIILKRETVQRHMFVCGTTGSGKSYAMGVIAEEIIQQGLPMVFIDTQDEYSTFVEKLGGVVLKPGDGFNIRISSLTESEVLDLLPLATTPLQRDIVSRAFSELESEIASEKIARFDIQDLVKRIADVGQDLTDNKGSIKMAEFRTATLKRQPIFGEGIEVEDWRKKMVPCMSINCKHLTTSRLQPVATAVLRELQTLRLHGRIPPYVAVIDEAHLFVPKNQDSPCKQIIREGVRIGRHHGIAMILMTQSPVDIDESTIRQCNTRFVFALEPDQLSAIQGVKADASEEMLRALPKMPQGTCILSGTYESVRHAIPLKIRLRKTEDSEGGKTPDIFAEMHSDWDELIAKLKHGK
jgi:hypothetical protein